MDQSRKIIHIDMDAFYASVEQHDNPELRGKPVAVGGSKERGVVAAASYEARKFGVRSAMPSARAYNLCPNIVFVHPRFERYKEVSVQIHEIFRKYTDLIEPLSLDEAYLDVTQNKLGIPSATRIAKAIRKEIKEVTGLTASAGISVNKFIAKVASDFNKPDGMTLVGPEKVEIFLSQLPIKKFYGVGKVTAEKMMSLGIHTGDDLKQWSEKNLVANFGKAGGFYYNIVRGNDDRPVNPNRIRKSLGAENTFSYDLYEMVDIKLALEPIVKTVHKRLHKAQKFGKTLTVKVKFKDFTQITRSQSFPKPIQSYDELFDHSLQILEGLKSNELAQGIRLLGITLSNFDKENKSALKEGHQFTLDF